MDILGWLATVPYPVLLWMVICTFLLLLSLLILIALSEKATGRVVRVIEAFRGEHGSERCPRCRSLLRRRAGR